MLFLYLFFTTLIFTFTFLVTELLGKGEIKFSSEGWQAIQRLEQKEGKEQKQARMKQQKGKWCWVKNRISAIDSFHDKTQQME